MTVPEFETQSAKAQLPEWRAYSGKGVAVHALRGSYAARRALAQLHEAERALDALAKLLQPPEHRQAPGAPPHLSIYLSDPIAGMPTDADTLQQDRYGQTLMRIVEPDSPGEPLARLLARSCIDNWFGKNAVEARTFVEGIAGVVQARAGGSGAKEADEWVRSQLMEGHPVSIFTAAPPSPSRGATIDRTATSFVSYLIETYGASCLRAFLSSYDPRRRDRAAEAAYQRPLGTLEEQWLDDLRRSPSGAADFRVLMAQMWPLIKPFWPRQAEILLYMLIGLAYSLVIPYASKLLLDSVIPSNSSSMLVTFIAALFGIFVLNLLMGMRSSYASTWVNTRILMGLQERMFAHLQRLSHNFYARAKVGDVITRLYSDLQIVQGAMLAVLNTALLSTLSAVGAAVVMFLLSPLLAILVIVVLPLFTISYLMLRTRLQKTSYKRQELVGRMYSAVQENLLANAVVKAFGMEKRSEQMFHNHLMAVFKSSLRLVVLSALFDMGTQLPVALGQILVMGVGGYMVMEGNLPVGTLVAFFGYLPSLYSPVAALAGLGQTVKTASGSLERVNELLNEPVIIEEKPDAVALPSLSHEIRLEHLSFSYDGDRQALASVDMVIPAGCHAAIVGPSGSGKSTVVNLLMRYWDPVDGRVLFNGHDLRDVTLESLRGQIGLVFQDTFVFDTTLRENIGLSKPGATDAEIAGAAKAAQLEEYVATLPAGYDTVLGERGLRMSGGQRQRLAIARALLRDPRLLILDEATSALDAQTEREILDTLMDVARGRTTVSVTHRLAFAARADLVFVLDGGRLVEQGKPAELARAGGLFQLLYDEQIGHVGRTAERTRIGIEGSQLRSIPLFSSLKSQALAMLAALVTRERYAPGEDVVRQGETGDKLYIVNQGQVEVLVSGGQDGGVQRVNMLNRGDYFGEMALLTGAPRTATVRTTMPSELYSLTQADFMRLLEREPALREEISETVAGRREALAQVNFLIAAKAQ